MCAEALGATRPSLHQSSNEAVATLAPELLEPRTASLPGARVFQSTGPPSLPSIHSTQTHFPRLPSNLHIIEGETPRKDVLPAPSEPERIRAPSEASDETSEGSLDGTGAVPRKRNVHFSEKINQRKAENAEMHLIMLQFQEI